MLAQSTSIVSNKSIVQPARLTTGRIRTHPKATAAAGSRPANTQNKIAQGVDGRRFGYSTARRNATSALATGSQGHAEFRLIVQEAFSSTIVDGKRVRVDLNRVGMWFADPKDDEFCLPGSGATPFDGDNEAGVQAFNSLNAAPSLRRNPRRVL